MPLPLAGFLPLLPSLGEAIIGGIFSNETAGRITRMVLNGVTQGFIGHEDLKSLDQQIKQMVAEGREPTDVEWAEWDAREALAAQKINSAADDN